MNTKNQNRKDSTESTVAEQIAAAEAAIVPTAVPSTEDVLAAMLAKLADLEAKLATATAPKARKAKGEPATKKGPYHITVCTNDPASLDMPANVSTKEFTKWADAYQTAVDLIKETKSERAPVQISWKGNYTKGLWSGNRVSDPTKAYMVVFEEVYAEVHGHQFVVPASLAEPVAAS